MRKNAVLHRKYIFYRRLDVACIGIVMASEHSRMTSLRETINAGIPSAVGAITDRAALAETFTPADCDLLELRLDALGHGPEVITFAKHHAPTLPLLLTARGPEEGGLGNLSISDRSQALTDLLPFASAIDIELRAVPDLASIWTQAKEQGLIRVASAHNFQSLPEDDEILALLDAMADADAEVAKIAFHLADEADLSRLATVTRKWGRLPLSFMGMGPLGPASRALAVQSGSVLNYGYLGQEPTAPGQWPARLLKEVIACTPGSKG